MKVLLIAASYLPRIGGRELYQDRVLGHFSPDEVVVLTPDREGNYAVFDAGYRFKVIRGDESVYSWFVGGRRAKARRLAALLNLCRKERPDVILCETVLPDGLSGWLLNQAIGVPYAVHAMGQDLARAAENEWTRARLAGLVSSASRFIAISDFMGQFLIKQGARPERVAVVVPGVNPVFLDAEDGRAKLVRERYGLEGKKVIVTVSRLVERKGQDKVIEAMPDILAQVPNAVYLLVGDGPDRERLEEIARRVGVQDRVIFTGGVPFDEVPPFYSASDVFAMPNREMPGDFEGFGIVFLEANARRIPVIGGRSGGAQNAVAHGESGYLVDPFDGADIAQALIKLLCNPDLARRLGEGGRRRVETEFSWDRAAKQVRTVIEKAADQPSLPLARQVWQTARTCVMSDDALLARSIGPNGDSHS